MIPEAVVMMVVTIVLVWGGLVGSVVSLVSHKDNDDQDSTRSHRSKH